MEEKSYKENKITKLLLIIYLIILTWIILFKMSFSIKELDYLRNINLIPLRESLMTNGRTQLSEVYENIIAFIPLGVYISMLKTKWSFIKRAITIMGVSFCYEVLQYKLAILFIANL